MFNLRQKGLTLIELLVAMGIFTVVIMAVVGLFISGNNSQRKINELYVLQRESSFIMEKMSREIRMAKSKDITQNNKYQIEFIDYNEDKIKYCLSDLGQNCREGSSHGFNYLLRENKDKNTKEIISSLDVSIESLRFIFKADDQFIQPLATITMEMKSKNGNSSLILQKTVTLRVYD